MAYVLEAPIQKLYTFTLKPEIFRELRRVQDRLNRTGIDRDFKSLQILKSMVETGGF